VYVYAYFYAYRDAYGGWGTHLDFFSAARHNATKIQVKGV